MCEEWVRRKGTVKPTGMQEYLMAVPRFQDLPLADRDRAWDGDAADKRVRNMGRR